ncbi:hypothetical protein DH2020_018040 [Rehmannia glutinosa]|uniref:Uncharacterized protein n=1 Tax=Rehmannia glutinosa TaxID=99300 RepID=A0ABR0WHR4_REHGL
MAVLNITHKFQRLLKKFSSKNIGDHNIGYEKLENNGDHQKGSRSRVPATPLYVGEDCKRYLVPTTAANSPVFVAMLDKYEDDINPFGPLILPCTAEAFEHVLRRAIDQSH